MRHALACCLLALAGCAGSPYAGQEAREIKALSASEVRDYLEGRGMGFAKPAELNGFPGPMHVLELADGLALDPGQREATARLMAVHKEEVRALGRDMIAAEQALEALFHAASPAPEAVAEAAARAAHIHGRIRAAHLTTHLAQAALLRPDQLRRYRALRGYHG